MTCPVRCRRSLSLLHQPVDGLEHPPGVAAPRWRRPARSGTRRWVSPIRAPTVSAVTVPSASTMAWSRRESASRAEPSACRAMALGGLRGDRDALQLGHPFEEVGGEVLGGQAAEVEPLAPADDGGRHLVRLGGGQDEADAGRGLLEHLQEGVERLARQALGLVDDVDLLPAHGRRGGGPLAELTGVVHPAVGGRVDLDDVEVRALPDPDALLADPARLGGRPVLAVDHLGQDPGRRGLARPPRPAEQEGVRETVLADRPDQGPDDVLLPDDLLGRLGAVLAVEGAVLVRHRRSAGYRTRKTGSPPPRVPRSSGLVRPAGPRLPAGAPIWGPREGEKGGDRALAVDHARLGRRPAR